MEVLAPDSGRTWRGWLAAVEVLRALPLGGLWSWPLRLPLLRIVPAALFDRLSRRREQVAEGIGLAGPAPAVPVPSPVRRWWWRQRPVLREVLVATVLMMVVMEILVANPAVPRQFKPTRPYWMVALIMYTHLYEGWTMFSPDAPTRDLMVYVDAFTRDGRHVDPLNYVGSRVHSLPLTDIPVRLGHDSFFCDYTLRIPDSGAYHPAFTEWILRHPKRTGNPGDEIVSFEAHVLEHTSPAPGEPGPKNPTDRIFLRYPAQP
jgi:hypothetical protein